MTPTRRAEGFLSSHARRLDRPGTPEYRRSRLDEGIPDAEVDRRE